MLLAHGRDPYFAGWPDTLQLDYDNPATQQAMVGELLKIDPGARTALRREGRRLVRLVDVARWQARTITRPDGTTAIAELVFHRAGQRVGSFREGVGVGVQDRRHAGPSVPRSPALSRAQLRPRRPVPAAGDHAPRDRPRGRVLRLLLGGRMLRRRRLRRLALAHLLRERGDDEEADGDGEGEERQVLRLLLGGRMLRRRRLRRLALGHLLSERGDDEEADDDGEGEGEERQVLRLLLGGRMLRRRRLRRLALAHLLRD